MLKKFCERLKKLRTDKEISQAKLGVMLDMSQQAIDRWEQGKTEPSLEMLVKLAIFFDVSAGYLLGLEELYKD